LSLVLSYAKRREFRFRIKNRKVKTIENTQFKSLRLYQNII